MSNIVPKKSKITFKYTQRQSDGLLTERILYALSDNNSKYLFNSIAIISGVGEQSIDGQTLMSPLNLTANQYYKRVRCLRNLGLISKKKSKFTLTLFGRIVYEGTSRIAQLFLCFFLILDVVLLSVAVRLTPNGLFKLTNPLLMECLWCSMMLEG